MPLFTGTPDKDTLVGTDDADLIQALAGNDYAFGAGGDDEIEGGEGNDILEGGIGSDQLHGDAGNDVLNEGAGESDSLYGDEGNDRLFYNVVSVSTPADALLDGGTGDDDLYYYSYPLSAPNLATLIGGDGADRISSSGGGAIGIDAGADADFVEIMNYATAYDIALGSGSDLLAMVSNQFFPSNGSPIIVSDFAAGDGGDSLALLSYLAWQSPGWSFAANPFATGHLQLVQQGADAVIRFDPDGAGDAYAVADLMVLQNVAVGALTARNLSGYASDGAATAGAAIDGTAVSDMLGATSGDDVVRGFAGNDILYGGAGDDRLEGGEGDDRLDGELGDDLIYGGEGRDNLTDRLAGSDQLFGEGGDDTLFVDRQWFPEPAATVLMDGGEGNDQLTYLGRILVDDVTMIGGGGNDFIRAYLGQNVTIDSGSGDDFVGIDMGIGHAEITLGAGADTLEPSMNLAPVVGFDVLDFETGDTGDRFYLVPLLPRLLSNWDPATNPFATNHLRLAQSGTDALVLYDTAGTGQNFKLLARLADVDAADLTQFNLGHAPAGPIAIAGTDGADSLAGTADADELIGFGGDDTYTADNAGDVIVEAVGGGFDQVYATISFALNAGAEVEVLAADDFASTASLNLVGNEFGQQIEGNAGGNVLDGKGGADAMSGYAGNDTYYVDNAGDIVAEAVGGGSDTIIANVSYTLGAGQEVELLRTPGSATAFAVNLTGNAFANTIVGNAAANVLDGKAGADAMYGYAGNDTYYVDHAGDIVAEAAGGGSDTIIANASYTLGAGQEVELLRTPGSATAFAVNLTGNAFANTFVGNAAANVLDGKAGADAMYGYAGNDTYYVDNGADTVAEAAAGGSDTIIANVSYTLGAGQEVELLRTPGSATAYAVNLTGNALANTLVGNAAANQLDGKSGVDALYGYGGADSFAFTTALGGGNVDTIGDLQAGIDKILLENAVFTGLAAGALAPGAFRTGSAAVDADDRIIYNSATGQLSFDADGGGGAAAVQFASLPTGLAIAASDFLVI